MSEANAVQIGGNHYKTKFEHWDLVVATGMGYFEGQITRYIARWRKKDGLKDLQKALHYIDKLAEITRGAPSCPSVPTGRYYYVCIDEDGIWEVPLPKLADITRFCLENELDETEARAIACIVDWRYLSDLNAARQHVQALIARAETRYLPDPVPVPLMEENHYSERARPDEDRHEH